MFALSLRVPHHLEKTAPSSTMLLVPSVSFFYMGAHDLRFVIDPCLEEEERSVGRCRRAKAFQDPSGGSRLKGEVAPPRRLRHHLLSHSNFFLFSPLPPFLLPPKKKHPGQRRPRGQPLCQPLDLSDGHHGIQRRRRSRRGDRLFRLPLVLLTAARAAAEAVAAPVDAAVAVCRQRLKQQHQPPSSRRGLRGGPAAPAAPDHARQPGRVHQQ